MKRFAILALALSGMTTAAVASDLNDLLYQDAHWGKQELNSRGYQQVGNSRTGHAQYWWNDNDGACVLVVFRDNKVDEIHDAPRRECRHDGRNDDERYDRRDDDNNNRYGNRDDDHRYSHRDADNRYERRNDDNARHGGERVQNNDMGRYCKGAAASQFGQRPQDILTMPVEHDHDMYTVFGQYPQQGSDVTTFACTFSAEGRLVGVDKN